jgi:carbon storage regulator
MLVVSRKLGERIVVPHCQLTVTIVSVNGDRVRLGISAPAEIAVHREEIWRQVCQRKHSCRVGEQGACRNGDDDP